MVDMYCTLKVGENLRYMLSIYCISSAVPIIPEFLYQIRHQNENNAEQLTTTTTTAAPRMMTNARWRTAPPEYNGNMTTPMEKGGGGTRSDSSPDYEDDDDAEGTEAFVSEVQITFGFRKRE
jgi:hypothetical protein